MDSGQRHGWHPTGLPSGQSFQESSMGFMIASCFYCYFYFSYGPLPTQGSWQTSLPLAPQVARAVLSEHCPPPEPPCPVSFLHTRPVSDRYSICLSLTSIPIVVTHWWSGRCGQRERGWLPGTSHFTGYFHVTLSPNLRSLCDR